MDRKCLCLFLYTFSSHFLPLSSSDLSQALFHLLPPHFWNLAVSPLLFFLNSFLPEFSLLPSQNMRLPAPQTPTPPEYVLLPGCLYSLSPRAEVRFGSCSECSHFPYLWSLRTRKAPAHLSIPQFLSVKHIITAG